MTTPRYEPDDGPLSEEDLRRLREAAAKYPRGRLLRRRGLSLDLLAQIYTAMSAGDYAKVGRLWAAEVGPRPEDDEPVGIDDLPRFGNHPDRLVRDDGRTWSDYGPP
ncbi:hypothetical protein [Cupriavidus consociatus]|uniref:hypothetical protein n=1 Tax=Cupriavidus consociatus TaxID=2821357 RepID=UPI001AE5B794|nr:MULTISPECIES: hypothetical protein [unclassified Cupriavidus]MBP0622887.1 hypothetical protein [Cupriavidus sp. LEh25]MDK2659573.1 hypothetical protein [Cupriavidus sp. LEh21]